MDLSFLEQLIERHPTPVLFVSEQRIRENIAALRTALPRVDLFYAVKANAHPDVLKIAADEGCFFDVCTTGELDGVRGAGIPGRRCLHTHPIKREEDIRCALDRGVRLFVADNRTELTKCLPFKNEMHLLIRISIQNPSCLVNLSHKFGIAPEEAFDLIECAHGMGLRVRGICFHAGSQNENAMKYIEALALCREICARTALAGIPLEIIDIGGGFPINYVNPVVPIAQFCRPVNEYLERFFSHYRIIAEPGRYIVGPAGTCVARVIGVSVRSGVTWYYLDEGIYGLFSGRIYDHAEYPVTVLRSGEPTTSVVAGPTCDSYDVLYENIPLPPLEIGDIMVFESMGAYTSASASTFNGYPLSSVVVV